MKIATLTVCMGGDRSSEGQLFSEKPFKTPAWLASAPQPLVDMDLGNQDCGFWVVVGELVNLVNLHFLTAPKMRTVMLWIGWCPHHLHKLLEVNLAITIGVHHLHQILGYQKMPFRRHINRICTNQANFLRQATARSCRRSHDHTFILLVSCEGKPRHGGKMWIMWIRFLVLHLFFACTHSIHVFYHITSRLPILAL